MKRSNSIVFASIIGAALLSLPGCDSEAETKKAEEAVKAAAESAAQAAAKEAEQKAQLAATKAAAKKAEAEKSQRPSTIDTKVTDDRRSEVEKAYADAKGFIVATDIEEQLKKNKAIKAKEGAIKTFDKSAKGKWVLFSGPMVNLTDDGFDLAVTYTPRAENDPMGMSRQFFTVTLSSIEGYEKDKFKAGSNVVVLAKYDGQAKASSGYELVEVGHWK